MDKPFRRILLIKMRFHGDMLLTTPVISSLKKNYPDAKIDVLLYQDTIPILSENPEINALYGIKNKKAKASEKIANFFHLIKVLRANKYDHLVPLQGGNVVESNLSVLTPLGLESLVKQTTMSYPPASWKRMRRELDHAGVGQNYVVIQPTARQIFKCWDNAKFSAVIDALHARGYEVVLTSGPDKDDLACVNEIAQGCETPPVTALAGKVTFPELGALIDHAQLFIGVDSAPAHIAAAVNTPLISLFGATDHIFWRPWSNNMIQFWAGDYREMPTRDQRDRNEMYLSVIPAADVIAAVDKLLPSSTTGTSL